MQSMLSAIFLEIDFFMAKYAKCQAQHAYVFRMLSILLKVHRFFKKKFLFCMSNNYEFAKYAKCHPITVIVQFLFITSALHYQHCRSCC